jgi:tetratricopeptide (TPR) repeat protein
VIDASAATEPATLSIARAATSALLSHLGDQDRAVVLAGDDGLRPIVPGFDKLSKIDPATRLQVQDALSDVARGGATDLGAMLSAAARLLDPTRRSAVIYIGDAAPTVGELSLASLRERIGKLPAQVRIFGLGVGDTARLDILAGLAQGAFAERISDGYQAARAALRVLEQTERPVWLGTKVDLGPGVERIFPRQASALVSGETLWVVGRLGQGKEPERLKTSGPAGQSDVPLKVVRFDDRGDLGRRWAEARLAQMLEDGEGRAALVDLGMKNGVITPVTSLYVPTKNEMEPDERVELEARRDAAKREAVGRRPANEDREQAGSSLFGLSKSSAAPASSVAAVADNKEGGTGTRARGEEGSMGSPSPARATAAKRMAAEAPAAAAAPEPERTDTRQALRGLSAVANAAPAPRAPPPAAQRAEDKPATPLERDGSIGADAVEAQGLTNDEFGEVFTAPVMRMSRSSAAGGLGLSGVGNGGGGVDNMATLGGAISATGKDGPDTGKSFGAGHGRLGGSHATVTPKVRMGATKVSGGLPPEVIQRIVRQNFGRFRLCYEQGLGRNPNLTGLVTVRFTIGRDGGVSNVADGGSALPDQEVVSCVFNAFYGLSFPQPESGVATVTYPLNFDTDGGGAKPSVSPAASVNVNVFIGPLPRRLLGCSAAADAPFEERVGLWRERLAKVANNPAAVAAVYRGALGACEAPAYRERARLLTLMLDAMAGVSGKVALYRAMARDLGAADVLYRGLLARIRTPEEMRELHRALGLTTVDPGVLAKLVSSTPDPGQRARKLSALLVQFPDDLSLALELLNAFEDAQASVPARDLARKLRERPDADARVRTAVGELYLRLAERASTPEDKAGLLAEGRRAFGEIVEFASEDPVARRRLGDLLLAHGFFADAARQYETLARLTPDDAKVLLLRASAAEGQGLLEDALKWAEKGGASGAPDGSSGAAVTARALAATHLAWARLAVADGKHVDELETLSARAARVLSGSRLDPDKPVGIRVSLTWSHPELHPSLWTNALGTAMPAADGDIALGVSQAIVPERPDSFVEVRLEPGDVAHVARLGATAELTIVFDELGKAEKIVRKRIRFEPGAPPQQRFLLAGKEVQGG